MPPTEYRIDEHEGRWVVKSKTYPETRWVHLRFLDTLAEAELFLAKIKSALNDEAWAKKLLALLESPDA